VNDTAGNNAQQITRTVNVALPADIDAPVITLHGSEMLNILIETEYIEQGATAIDERDGEVDVTITGEVNSSKVGEYNLTYSAKDSAGNIATKVRTVAVYEDVTAPVITLNGDEELMMIQLESYVEKNATAIDDSDGEVDVTITGEVNSSKVGDYNFTYSAKDSTGNSTTKVRKIHVNPLILTHNDVEYGIVISSYTGRIWLDRNLGAKRVCTSSSDTECYGDYYQWGRASDGHQKAESSTTSTLFDNINDTNSAFVLSSKNKNFDWTSVDSEGELRKSNWDALDGSSVCPEGYRVPTVEEFKKELFGEGTENVTNSKDMFNSFLKIPIAGYRNNFDGKISPNFGLLWSSSEIVLYFTLFTAEIKYTGYRANANSVRCIKAK
jgi:uncharacterized protein (TIGR02145 family)